MRPSFRAKPSRNGERPGWLVNLTNDGWFGISLGPYQHFQQARMLAIAEGLPLVRAANTGISAVIDPVGRIVTSLPLGTEGILDARLPQAIAPTLYVRVGDEALIVLSAVGASASRPCGADCSRSRLRRVKPLAAWLVSFCVQKHEMPLRIRR